MESNYLRTPELVLAKDKLGPVYFGLNSQTYNIALINWCCIKRWYLRWFPNEFSAKDASPRRVSFSIQLGLF